MGALLRKVFLCDPSKKHTFNNTVQTAKKSIKQFRTSAAVKLPPKAALTRSFFQPLRTTGIDTETTEAENALPKQEAPRKSGRPPSIVKASTTNIIRFQSDLKEHVKGEYGFIVHYISVIESMTTQGPSSRFPFLFCSSKDENRNIFRNVAI
jgi:hypothetical protein